MAIPFFRKRNRGGCKVTKCRFVETYWEYKNGEKKNILDVGGCGLVKVHIRFTLVWLVMPHTEAINVMRSFCKHRKCGHPQKSTKSVSAAISRYQSVVWLWYPTLPPLFLYRGKVVLWRECQSYWVYSQKCTYFVSLLLSLLLLLKVYCV